MKILVACHNLVVAGGLIRFEKVGRVLQKFGHEIVFATFDANPNKAFDSEFRVMSFDEAKKRKWDASIIPGAGFPRDMIDRFPEFKNNNFGTRIQMVLNDQSKRDNFVRVNYAFHPELVIFNSDHWPVGSYREFKGCQFYTLIGGIDTTIFRPAIKRVASDRFIIGAQLAKNPGPIVEALTKLPPNFCIRFFGVKRHDFDEKMQNFIDEGRIEIAGKLFDEDLACYYRGLNVMVSSEMRAGWANVVAEAMASGVPVVTTPYGSGPMAIHEETALVVENDDVDLLAHNILRLSEEAEFASEMAENARVKIQQFDWVDYTAKLIRLIRRYDGENHYINCPEWKLFGKTAISERLEGLEKLLSVAKDKVILDLGAAEGIVAREFLKNGAKSVSSFELEESRVLAGRKLINDPRFTFEQANLSLEESIQKVLDGAPQEGYDIVLYLGIHHHLDTKVRCQNLTRLLEIATNLIAIRTPVKTFEEDQIHDLVTDAGFELWDEYRPGPEAFSGPLWIYKRT